MSRICDAVFGPSSHKLYHILKSTTQNKLVNIVEFLNILQEPAEPVAKFVSRVKGQAKVCDFTVKCPGDECDKVVSYSEQLVSHVIVRGLEDSEIQERVLALAATEENLDLKRISEYIYAQETGRESRKLLSAAGDIIKNALKDLKTSLIQEKPM